jgi:hypothetical protein
MKRPILCALLLLGFACAPSIFGKTVGTLNEDIVVKIDGGTMTLFKGESYTLEGSNSDVAVLIVGKQTFTVPKSKLTLVTESDAPRPTPAVENPSAALNPKPATTPKAANPAPLKAAPANSAPPAPDDSTWGIVLVVAVVAGISIMALKGGGIGAISGAGQKSKIDCPQCDGSMRKTIKSEGGGCGVKVVGLMLFLVGVLMLFFFPFGTLLGVALMIVAGRIGSTRQKKVWTCGECGYFFERD